MNSLLLAHIRSVQAHVPEVRCSGDSGPARSPDRLRMMTEANTSAPFACGSTSGPPGLLDQFRARERIHPVHDRERKEVHGSASVGFPTCGPV